MSQDVALQLVSKMFMMALIICGPVLGITLLVGVLVSVIQVVTQIHDTSLTFIPKLLTAGICLLFFGGWMLHKMVQYATGLWSSIPGLIS